MKKHKGVDLGSAMEKTITVFQTKSWFISVLMQSRATPSMEWSDSLGTWWPVTTILVNCICFYWINCQGFLMRKLITILQRRKLRHWRVKWFLEVTNGASDKERQAQELWFDSPIPQLSVLFTQIFPLTAATFWLLC